MVPHIDRHLSRWRHQTRPHLPGRRAPGRIPLRVHCYSHNCDPTAIRHALQLATGLWLCRCDACFAAFRAGQPPTGAAYGLLWRGNLQVAAYDLHICEGLADGLRILHYAADPALVAVCASTSYARIESGYFNSITLWPDADDPGTKPADKIAQRWADLGYDVIIKRLAAGHDLASTPLQEPKHE